MDSVENGLDQSLQGNACWVAKMVRAVALMWSFSKFASRYFTSTRTIYPLLTPLGTQVCSCGPRSWLMLLIRSSTVTTTAVQYPVV
jgi:hypothetical protein